MNLLVRIKHWQLFIFLVGIPISIQLFLIFISLNASSNYEIVNIILGVLVPTTFFFIWQYILGVKLHQRLPDTLKMNLNKFRILLVVPVIYILFISFFVVKILSLPITVNIGPYILLFFLIIPIHLFSMFCIFYCLYFNSKALKSVELGKEAILSDYILEFFLLWFFPIGVWIIQPRINKIFSNPE